MAFTVNNFCFMCPHQGWWNPLALRAGDFSVADQNFEVVLSYPACRLDKPRPRFIWISVAINPYQISTPNGMGMQYLFISEAAKGRGQKIYPAPRKAPCFNTGCGVYCLSCLTR